MVTAIYWLLFLAVVVYLFIYVGAERARRARIRRLREFRERRAWRDSQIPKRWE